MKTLLLTLLIPGVALLAQKPAPTAAKKPAPPGSNRALLTPSALKAKAPEEFKATFTTTKGDFVVDVHREWAPLGADRFYNLVKNGFFTDAAFFRVVPGFVVQFGLSANPAVNKAWENAKIPDDAVKQTNKKGYLTFATSGANTRTTQLFINLVDNPRLDAMGFAPFGAVIEGMENVEKIYPGYGESPDQGAITKEGKAYLDKNFPQLDRVTAAKITFPAAAPAKPATPARKTTSRSAPVKK